MKFRNKFFLQMRDPVPSSNRHVVPPTTSISNKSCSAQFQEDFPLFVPVRMWLLYEARKLAIHRASFGRHFLRFWFPKSVAWWGAPLQNLAMLRSLIAGVSGNGKRVSNRDRNHGPFWWIFYHWRSGINRREPKPMAASAVRLNGKADDNNNNSQATKQRYHCCVIL